MGAQRTKMSKMTKMTKLQKIYKILKKTLKRDLVNQDEAFS